MPKNKFKIISCIQIDFAVPFYKLYIKIDFIWQFHVLLPFNKDFQSTCQTDPLILEMFDFVFVYCGLLFWNILNMYSNILSYYIFSQTTPV